MTGDEKTNDDSKQPENFPNAGTPVPRAVFSDDFDDPENTRDQDELPEDEPLTPELVEEEAIRGDFMLRWATVFLAVLMAFGQLNDTRPLVLIRSGDQMRSNGFLPSRADQFSITMDGKSVTNVSWLFDHLVSLSWLIAGEKGLTLLKVLLAGIFASVLVRISVPGVSSWWSSICAVFAVVACSSDFLPLPELITILGMTLTMRFLFLQRMGKATGLLWKLPLLFVIWCNLDPRAWVGAGVVVSYSLGSWLSGKLAARKRSLPVAGEERPLFAAVLLSVLALLVNPFHINSLLGPLTTYSIEYPAMRAQRSLEMSAAARSFDGRVDFYSVLKPDAMKLFDHSQVAGLALLLMAMIVLVLARSARDLGFLAALIFVTGLVLLAAHELPAAAVVAAVVAGVAAQDWYRRSFSMKYSTDTTELLLSRGGRAVTVFALAMLGFCAVASRLPGATPLGFGFDRETKITLDTFAEQIARFRPEARFLHTRIEQGDMLIWNGRKSFVDSRVLPFGRPDDEERNSVFSKHKVVLETFLHPRQNTAPVSSDPQEKQRQEAIQQQAVADAREALAEFQISHILVRMAPPGPPDFRSIESLVSTGEWFPVSIGPSAAVVERITPGLTEEEFRNKSPNFPKLAFQASDLPPSTLRQFVSPPGFYEKYVYRNRTVTDANKRMAGHFLVIAGDQLASGFQPQNSDQAFAGLAPFTLAIRHLNLSLTETPGDADSYVMLGRAYSGLGIVEQILSGQKMSDRLRQMRYLQAVIAYRQATIIDPENIAGWERLLSEYQRMSRLDLAGEALTQWLTLADKNPSAAALTLGLSSDAFEELRDQRYEMRSGLEEQLGKSDEQIEKMLKQQEEQAQQSRVASTDGSAEAKQPGEAEAEEAQLAIRSAIVANLAGRPQRGLNALKEKLDVVKATPIGTVLLGQLLLEAGELEQGYLALAGLSREALRQPQTFVEADWQLPTAISQLGIGDYTSVVETWNSQLSVMNIQATSPQLYSPALFSLPMVADANFAMNGSLPVWPVVSGQTMAESVQLANEMRSEISLLVTLVRLEEGNLKDAKTMLARSLAEYGETSSRRLASIYYSLMDDQAESFFTQNSANTWEEFEYPGEILPQPANPAPGKPPGTTPQSGAIRTPSP